MAEGDLIVHFASSWEFSASFAYQLALGAEDIPLPILHSNAIVERVE